MHLVCSWCLNVFILCITVSLLVDFLILQLIINFIHSFISEILNYFSRKIVLKEVVVFSFYLNAKKLKATLSFIFKVLLLVSFFKKKFSFSQGARPRGGENPFLLGCGLPDECRAGMPWMAPGYRLRYALEEADRAHGLHRLDVAWPGWTPGPDAVPEGAAKPYDEQSEPAVHPPRPWLLPPALP